MSRWENAPTLREVVRMTYAMIDIYCSSYPRPPAAVTLDIDDTVDVVPAISNSRCSMRITMNGASCRSMFMRVPPRGRWRFCCDPARHHQETKSAPSGATHPQSLAGHAADHPW